MESTEIALDNNKENGIYGQLIMELICRVNPDDLDVCFDEVLSHFKKAMNRMINIKNGTKKMIYPINS